MRRMRIPGFELFLGFLLVSACSKAPEAANSPAVQEGQTIFQTRCFVCHGREGKGNGPASSGLGSAVRDLTSPSWQDSMSDETIRSVVRNGAQAIGGSIAMAPNRDLSDAQIESLVRYIRQFRQQPQP